MFPDSLVIDIDLGVTVLPVIVLFFIFFLTNYNCDDFFEFNKYDTSMA